MMLVTQDSRKLDLNLIIEVWALVVIGDCCVGLRGELWA